MVKLYCDGGDFETVAKYVEDDRIHGFTTNPTLMKKLGIKRYRDFAKEMLSIVKGKPISFEVLTDDFYEMETEANLLQALGENVWVKIPITNTKGESSIDLINSLKRNVDNFNLNITAILTEKQVSEIVDHLDVNDIISIFAGRILDTDSSPIEIKNKEDLKPSILWASCREVMHFTLAKEFGYDIITMSPDLIEKKFKYFGMDLEELSLLTVKQFHEDGKGIEF